MAPYNTAMAKNDHYVPRTYLELFLDSTSRGRLYAYSKRTGKAFQTAPASVCCERDGDFNPKYLRHPHLLGEFRAIYESQLQSSIRSLEARRASVTDKHVIAMFMASLIATMPAWKRAGTEIANQLWKRHLVLQREMRIKHNVLADFPMEGIEMLERGELEIATDADYVKAVATRSLMPTALSLFQEDWIIGINETTTPFLTSDYPFAIDWVGDYLEGVMYRHLPLTPRVSVTVAHSGRFPLESGPDAVKRVLSTPRDGGLRYTNLRPKFIERVNNLLVQCAEDHVFSSQPSDATAQVVNKYAHHRLTVEYIEIPDGRNAMIQGTILTIKQN